MCVCLDSSQNEYKIKQFYELLSLQMIPLWFAGCEYGLLSQATFYYRICVKLLTTRWQQNFHPRIKEKKNTNDGPKGQEEHQVVEMQPLINNGKVSTIITTIIRECC